MPSRPRADGGRATASYPRTVGRSKASPGESETSQKDLDRSRTKEPKREWVE